MRLNEAIDTIKEALEEKDYFYGWQSNIAMFVMDAYSRKKKELGKSYLTHTEMKQAVNEGAIDFINVFTGKIKVDL